jgi:hypothetical protein
VILTERKIHTETDRGTVEQIFRFSNIQLLDA